MMKFAALGLRIHGHGAIAEVLAAGDTQLVAIAETEESVRHDASQRYGVPTYANYLELLERERPDLAIVCPPHDQKATVTLECLSRGIHVLVDKPMAISVNELAEVAAEIARGRAEFSMMLTERFGPTFVRLKELVEAGEFGNLAGFVALRPHELRANLPASAAWMRDAQRGAGIIVDLMIHDIDLIRWYSGREVTQVFAQHHAATPSAAGVHDMAQALFTLQGGIPASVEADWLTPRNTPWDCRFFLTGTTGAAEIKSLGYNELTIWSSDRPHRLIDVPKARTDSSGQDLIRRIRGQQPQILGAADAIKATRAVLAGRTSAQSGQPVDLVQG